MLSDSLWQKIRLETVLTFANGRTSPKRDELGHFAVFGSNGEIGRSTQSNSEARTIIIGRVGSFCGSLRFSNAPCWVTDNAIRANAKQGNDPRFLYYLLQALDLGRLRGGSGQPLLNQAVLNATETNVPTEGEQGRIADLLSALDERIASLKDVSRTLESLATSIFKSWFVDFDLVRAKAEGREPEGMDAATAAFFPSSLVQEESRSVPQGWTLGQLGLRIAVNPVRKLRSGEEATYLDMANVPTSGPSVAGTTMRAVGSGSKFILGDTLFAKITPCLENGKTAFVDFLQGGQVGWGSTELLVLRPEAQIPPSFAYLLARDPAFRTYAERGMTGTSGRQRVPPEHIRKYSMVFADDSVYKAFERIVDPLFACIKANADIARTLTELRDTLLPRLISGKLRIPEAEKLVASAL